MFSIAPGKPDRGTFLDVGIDFVEVGRLAGALAANVLRGTDPATIPIRDVLDEVPRRIIINTVALRGLNEPWRVPEEARSMATILVDETGIHDRSTKGDRGVPARPLAKRWNVDLLEYNTVVDAPGLGREERALGGPARLRASWGGRDYQRQDLATRRATWQRCPALIDAATTERRGPFMIITFSTPTLQAALRRANNVPVVFNYVASGPNECGCRQEQHRSCSQRHRRQPAARQLTRR